MLETFALVTGGNVSGTMRALGLAWVVANDAIGNGPVVTSTVPVCAISGPVPGASSSASIGASSSER